MGKKRACEQLSNPKILGEDEGSLSRLRTRALDSVAS